MCTTAGNDLTQSSLRDTQEELERILPVSVLSDAVFHGQHLVTGLLEKTDKDFKTALDNIISTDVWLQAQELARERRKGARAAREQLVGRIMEKDEEQHPLQEAMKATIKRVESWQHETERQREALTAQLQQAQAAADRDGFNVSSCREELAVAQRRQVEQQEALDVLMDTISQARRSFDARRLELQQALAKAKEVETMCRSRVELMAARAQELNRARQREAAAKHRVRSLQANASRWEAGQQGRVLAASQALNRALVRCEEIRQGMADAADRREASRVGLVKALNASIIDVEAAAAQVAAYEEAASSVQSRAAQYAELEHEPSCRLCLQSIDAQTHANHLSELQKEVGDREQALQAARARFQDAQAQRRRAHGLVDGHDEAARSEERMQRQQLQAAEGQWNTARMAIAAIELEHNPAAAALAAAREEQERAQVEVEALVSFVDAFCRDLAPADGLLAVREGDRGAVDLLQDAESKLESSRLAAAAADQKLSEEVLREDASVVEREATMADARGKLQDCAKQVAYVSQRLDTALERGREIEQVASKVAELEKSENPWRHELIVRKAAIDDNNMRLQGLREELLRADGDVVLWGQVDELLGKRGLQSFVYEVAVVELQRRAAKYLDILSEDSLRLELALATQVVERRLLVRLADGSYAARTLHQRECSRRG